MALINGYFDKGTGQIVLDVQCSGSENELLACIHAPILNVSRDCYHAGVRCEGACVLHAHYHGCMMKCIPNIMHVELIGNTALGKNRVHGHHSSLVAQIPYMRPVRELKKHTFQMIGIL